jgi:hypothetical protein
MRQPWRATVLCCLLVAPVALAQQTPVDAEAEAQTASQLRATGDKAIDARLLDMDTYARTYPEAFVDEIGRYLDVPRGYASALLNQQGWPAGDIWYACALGKVIGQPCRAVVRARVRTAEGGWSEVAQSLDVSLDRRQRQSLRDLSERSYRHWARPLPKG